MLIYLRNPFPIKNSVVGEPFTRIESFVVEIHYCVHHLHREPKPTQATERRVTQLSLGGAGDWGLGEWVLNASLFLPFKELQSLDLRETGLVSCMENEG